MNLTAQLPAERREHVETRLREDPIAWLTTVRQSGQSGQPDSVPVWFLVQDDDTIVVYSQTGKLKLTSIAANPQVTLTIDGTAGGSDVVRLEGTAVVAEGFPPSSEHPQYAAKYAAKIQDIFGTPARFAEEFPVPLVITPSRLRA